MTFPISVYWYGKPVPRWLEKITVKGNCVNPMVAHRGFGIVYRSQGLFKVIHLTGCFLYVDAPGCHVVIEGQGGGVYIIATPLWFKVLVVAVAAALTL